VTAKLRGGLGASEWRRVISVALLRKTVALHIAVRAVPNVATESLEPHGTYTTIAFGYCVAPAHFPK
jgi:hypothetical protein